MPHLTDKHAGAAGSLDPDFGLQGFAQIGSEKQFSTGTHGLVRTAEGQLLAAWSAAQASDTLAGLARFSAEGQIDTAYGDQGLATGGFKEGYRTSPQGVLLLGKQRALMFGNYLIYVEPTFQTVPSLLCFTVNGEVDVRFGTRGVFSLPELPPDEKYGLLCSACVLPEGAILMLYNKIKEDKSTSYIIKLTHNGAVDPGFGEQGICRFSLPGQTTEAGGILLLKNGRFVLFNSFESQTSFIACFEKHGALVRDFGEKGVKILSYLDKFYTQLNLAETETGLVSVGIVVLGTNLYRGLMTGLTQGGQVDPQFNLGEPVIITHPAAADGMANCHQIVVQEDNKLVIAGYRPLSSPEPAGFIGRYLPDGKPDDGFGKSGLATTGELILTAAQRGLTDQPEAGRLVVAGVHQRRGALAAFNA